MDSLGLGGLYPLPDARPAQRRVLVRRALQRVLAFRGRTIDDVVNDPIVKNEILGFWKLDKQIDRAGEILELERQWSDPLPSGRQR